MIKASIIGASGYSGAELVKILLRHKEVKIEKLFANASVGKQIDTIYPWLNKRIDTTLETYSVDAACASDVVFIALPSGEAMNTVPELFERGKKIIDLGGDFRLQESALYEKFYKHDHKAKSMLPQAVYGLPEWNRDQIKSANIIANPGCYATSAILTVAPVLKEGLIDEHGIAISSLSGVSGAGRSTNIELSFTEVNESVKAYKVGVHQHTPEINSTLTAITGKHVSATFVPHLLPITRGIYTSIYAPLKKNVTPQEISAAFKKYYFHAPFVRYSNSAVPEIKNVNYTNYIDIGFHVYPENNQLILFSAIDNLIKGAAGQAVQNMNIMFGYNESEGLV
ncbi:MAG: N-acetyl-gamma-glutamyl-phosphate reductase [Ignavibacteriales bacterium]|nr:N-acetyl-gamma-glutamyl-phosphate reductase [Ignavibacteriales bacterium]